MRRKTPELFLQERSIIVFINVTDALPCQKYFNLSGYITYVG